MSINTAVNIDVNVDGTQTVKQAAMAYEDLGDAFAKTQREAEAMALQYGINDERTQEAIKTAGRYKQQLEQLDQAIDAHRGGQETLFRAVQGVTAGFEVATGAMALFGSESEDLQKILMKVQGAMIFSQGLKDLKEFAPAILNIATATRTWFISLSLVQKAFLSLGIGILIDLVVRLSDAFSGVSEETLKASKAQQEYNDKIRDFRKERELLENGEEQFTRNESKRVDARLLEVQQELEKKTDYRKKYLRDIKILGIEEAESERQRREDELKQLRLLNEQLINEQIKLDLKVQQYDEAERARKKALAESTKKDETKAQEDFYKVAQRMRREYNEVQGKEIKSSSDEIIENMRLAIESQNVILGDSVNKQLSSLEMLKLGVSAFGVDFVNTFMSAFEAVALLEEAYASSSEQSQKKAFEIRKAFAITQATISTIEATLNAFKTASESPISKLFPAYPFIQAGIAGAFGVAKIKEIGKQQFRSTTPPSIGSSVGGSVSVPTTLRASSVNVGNEFVTADRRVYVLQGDITRTINNVNNTRAVSVVE